MKQSLFESRHQASWTRFAERLTALETPAKKPKGKPRIKPRPADYADFGGAYRQLCQQLALAQERGYSSHLVDPLQQLAMRGHQQLYRHRGHLLASVLRFLLAGFPQQVRAEWRFVACAALVFFGALITMGLLVYLFPNLIYSVLGAPEVTAMEAMYDPALSRLGRAAERGSGDDMAMFGFYIMNNIGISFQTFASGLLAGVGSLFYMLFNGLNIGAVAGHLSQIGSGLTFWSFVVGHSAFELTALVLSGAAGLKIGWALLSPGRLSRTDALRKAAGQAMQLIYGVIVFLLIAAFIEAYWSSLTLFPPLSKFIVGAVLWALVAMYLLLAGRGAHAPD